MATPNELRDEIVTARAVLVASLNELHEVDPDGAYMAYGITMAEIQNHFKGAKPSEEDVEEKGNVS